MKRISIIFTIIALAFCACTHKQAESRTSHMYFMGMSIDGSQQDFLSGLATNFQEDDLWDNLELRVDSVSQKSFICSQQGMGAYESNIWFEFFFFTEPYNNDIVGLQGLSIITPQTYDVLRICLIEKFGSPVYNKQTLTPELMGELDVHESMVYNDLECDDFEVWKTEDGYIILQRSPSTTNENLYCIEMDVVDKVNFDQYIDAQLAEQENE